MYVRIINFTYYNYYGGMMRGKYYINITLRFLFFYLTIMSTSIMYQHNYKYMHYACIMYHLLYMLVLRKWIKLNQINMYIVLGWF